MLDVLKKSDIALFEGREVDLLIESYSNSARILQIRGFTDIAQIIANHTTSSDRSLATSTVAITGIPVTLTVTCATAGISRGECYVRISLRVDGVVVALLGACYLTDTSTLQWPGGKIESSTEGPGLIRSITGTNPAAGVECSETVPTGAKWRLITLIANLTTSADVANRGVSFALDDGTSVFWRQNSGIVQAAGNTFPYILAAGIPPALGTTFAIALCAPANVLLAAGYKVSTITALLQAADNWAAPQLLVEEWIEP